MQHGDSDLAQLGVNCSDNPSSRNRKDPGEERVSKGVRGCFQCLLMKKHPSYLFTPHFRFVTFWKTGREVEVAQFLYKFVDRNLTAWKGNKQMSSLKLTANDCEEALEKVKGSSGLVARNTMEVESSRLKEEVAILGQLLNRTIELGLQMVDCKAPARETNVLSSSPEVWRALCMEQYLKRELEIEQLARDNCLDVDWLINKHEKFLQVLGVQVDYEVKLQSIVELWDDHILRVPAWMSNELQKICQLTKEKYLEWKREEAGQGEVAQAKLQRLDQAVRAMERARRREHRELKRKRMMHLACAGTMMANGGGYLHVSVRKEPETRMRCLLTTRNASNQSVEFLASWLHVVIRRRSTLRRYSFGNLGCTSALDLYIPTFATKVVSACADWNVKKVRCKSSKVDRGGGGHGATFGSHHGNNFQRKVQVASQPTCHRASNSNPNVSKAAGTQSDRSSRERSCSTRNRQLQGSRHSTVGLPVQLLMLEATLLLAGKDVHDKRKDWRLHLDSISYEELLELGERIGYFNMGLSEDTIIQCLMKMKHCILEAASARFLSENERCSICREKYEANDELGKTCAVVVFFEAKLNQITEAVMVGSESGNLIIMTPTKSMSEAMTANHDTAENQLNKMLVENRIDIDTAPPFESVKQAANMFRGIANWKAQRISAMKRGQFGATEFQKSLTDFSANRVPSLQQKIFFRNIPPSHSMLRGQSVLKGGGTVIMENKALLPTLRPKVQKANFFPLIWDSKCKMGKGVELKNIGQVESIGVSYFGVGNCMSVGIYYNFKALNSSSTVLLVLTQQFSIVLKPPYLYSSRDFTHFCADSGLFPFEGGNPTVSSASHVNYLY
eukprot:Gb_27385 [translate_table: standard]